MHQFALERASREVALQEHDQVSIWQEDATAEDHDSRLPTNRLIEGVETGCRQDESAHIRQQRKKVYSQRNSRFLSKSHQESLNRRVRILVLIAVGTLGGVQFQVWVVCGSEVVGVLALVLLVVCLVDPREGVHEHVVKGGCDVAHERHEEERYLQDRVLDEVDAFDYILVPCRLREIREEAEERDQDTNAGGLRENMSGFEQLNMMHSKPYRYSHEDSDHYACQHRQCCLLVMLAGKQSRVLECSQGAHDGELGAPKDGIGLKMAHLAMRMCS
jgi:hypothetical protein